MPDTPLNIPGIVAKLEAVQAKKFEEYTAKKKSIEDMLGDIKSLTDTIKSSVITGGLIADPLKRMQFGIVIEQLIAIRSALEEKLKESRGGTRRNRRRAKKQRRRQMTQRKRRS
jgi:organic radical activating enzyme